MDSLNSLNGFINLQSIEGDFQLQNVPLLRSVKGLENVMKIGVPYLIRHACVANRIIRLVSCVPGRLRESCSIFCRNACAASESVGTYRTFVKSPPTGFSLPFAYLNFRHNAVAICTAPFSNESAVNFTSVLLPQFRSYAHTDYFKLTEDVNK